MYCFKSTSRTNITCLYNNKKRQYLIVSNNNRSDMLAKLAPSFVISRVIQNAYFVDMMNVQLLKQPFGTHRNYFGMFNAEKFYECKFYGYISSLAPPTEFTHRFEAEAYNNAVQKFKTFNSVLSLVEAIDDFNDQLRHLYSYVERNNSSANIFAHHKETTDQFEHDVLNALDRYNKFIRDLEAYPEWKKKVEEEVGNWIHQIHNNIEESKTKRRIFEKMNRQEYFI